LGKIVDFYLWVSRWFGIWWWHPFRTDRRRIQGGPEKNRFFCCQ